MIAYVSSGMISCQNVGRGGNAAAHRTPTCPHLTKKGNTRIIEAEYDQDGYIRLNDTRRLGPFPRCTSCQPVQWPGEWADRGACRDADQGLFFKEGSGASYPKGKAICRDCPVREECLEFALVNREKFGLWGGQGPKERAATLRARAKGAAA